MNEPMRIHEYRDTRACVTAYLYNEPRTSRLYISPIFGPASGPSSTNELILLAKFYQSQDTSYQNPINVFEQ